MGRPTKEQQAAKLLAAQNDQEDSILELARLKLDELMVKHNGQLTMGIVHEYLKVVSVDFNLSDIKKEELKEFKYSREIETENPFHKHEPQSHEDNQVTGGYQEAVEQPSEHISTNITEADFFALQEHCERLEDAISRLAVNTGNGNWISEYGIERWIPGKKHMNKRYA